MGKIPKNFTMEMINIIAASVEIAAARQTRQTLTF